MFSALGASGAGRRVVLKAVAARRGICDPDEIEKMYEGKSDAKLKLPGNFRAAVQGKGLGDTLAPIHVMTLKYPSRS